MSSELVKQGHPISDENAELFAEFLETMRMSEAAWQKAIEPILAPLLEGLKPLSEAVSSTDWDALGEEARKALKSRRERIVRLAEFGWTVGSCLPFLLETDDSVALTQGSVDSFFVELYREGEWRLAKDVVKELQASPYLRKSEVLLDQIVSALERDHYAIVVPSLMIVTEGYFAELASTPPRLRDTNILRRLREEESRAQSSKTLFLADVWPGLVKFFEQLFKASDFAANPPAFANRHWILHGRTAEDGAVADAVRLLNALSTLNWLVASPFPEGSEG